LRSDINLILSDINRLSDNTFTYCSDSGLNLSWTDHLLCSPVIDDLISRVNTLYDFVSSDHKPITVCFEKLLVCSESIQREAKVFDILILPDWESANKMQLNNYRDKLAGALCNVIIPSALLCDLTDNCSTDITGAIENYYNDVIQCVHFATNGSIPVKSYKNGAYNIPGWNDVVSDKH